MDQGVLRVALGFQVVQGPQSGSAPIGDHALPTRGPGGEAESPRRAGSPRLGSRPHRLRLPHRGEPLVPVLERTALQGDNFVVKLDTAPLHFLSKNGCEPVRQLLSTPSTSSTIRGAKMLEIFQCSLSGLLQKS